MASGCRRTKNDKSSIRCWWIPLEVQSFELDNIFSGKGAYSHLVSQGQCRAQSETKSSDDGMSTVELVSKVVGLWDCVGQSAVFQTKASLKYDDISQKENVICYPENRKQGSTSSFSSENVCNDFSPVSCFSSTAKSDFENLKTTKKTFLFASCNRSINDSFNWNDTQSSIDSCGINKVANIGAPEHMGNKVGRISIKPFFALKDLEKFTRNECNATDESCIIGQRSPTADLSATQIIESVAITEGESSNSGGTMNLEEESPHPSISLYSTYSLQPVTNSKEAIIVLRSPGPSISSECNVGVVTSFDPAFGQIQQFTDSISVVDESSVDESNSSNHNIHENCKSIHHFLDQKQEFYPKHQLSIQYKLQHAFAQNKHALAGAFAGTLVSLCLHPVDTVKTIIQANGMGQKSSYHIVKTIISEKGILGLYRGIASNIASSAPISAIYTYTYESVKGALVPLLPKEYHSFAHCVAGGCSSVATSFIFTPSERIKQQMQVGLQYQNCWSALIGCLEKGGVPSLYAGWGAVLCRNIPHSIIKFYTYESLKQLFLRSGKSDGTSLNPLQTLACGGLAGSTAALFTTPFDVVKTRLQTQAPGSLAKYDGVLHALQEIARNEGLQGLYRGLTPRLAMYVSQGAIFFASYEFLKAVFSLEAPRAPARVIGNEDNTVEPPRLHKLH